MTEKVIPNPAEISHRVDALFDVADNLPTYGALTDEPDAQVLGENFGTVLDEVANVYDARYDTMPEEQQQAYRGHMNVIRGTLDGTISKSPRFVQDIFNKLGTDDKTTLVGELQAMVQTGTTTGIVDRDDHIVMRAKSDGGYLPTVEGEVYNFVKSLGLADSHDSDRVLGLMASDLSHSTYLIKDGDKLYSYFSPHGRDDTKEIVLNVETARALGQELKTALQHAKVDPKILENLGVSFEQLGMYHVAVHEMAHFMADMAKPYAVQRGWEKLYLLDHPEESFAPVLVDAVAAEQERFAEGIAQLMLKERLAELDIPEQATDVAFKYMNQNTIRGHAYTYLLLHDVSDEGMGLDEEGYRKAANLGYGYPLTLEQLKERLTYMFDYVGMQPEDVKKKYAELQEVNWREHTAGAIYHELPKAPELPKLQTNERKKKRIRRFVGSAMLAASIYKSALFNKGESEDN